MREREREREQLTKYNVGSIYSCLYQYQAKRVWNQSAILRTFLLPQQRFLGGGFVFPWQPIHAFHSQLSMPIERTRKIKKK